MPVLCVLLTAHEVANLLRIDTNELNKRVSRGEGPKAFTVDGYLFHPQIVETYLQPGKASKDPSFDLMPSVTHSKVGLMTPEEAADFLRSAVLTLARWRGRGVGPRYSKLGGQIVYQEADLLAFVEASAKSKTRGGSVPTHESATASLATKTGGRSRADYLSGKTSWPRSSHTK